jgi:hypothetical protein
MRGWCESKVLEQMLVDPLSQERRGGEPVSTGQR